MPLMACPECSNATSTGAKVCPHCGYPIKRKRPPTVVASLVAIFVSVPTAAAVLAVVLFDASLWVVVPVWVLVMTWLQLVMAVQRRDWHARYLVPTPAEAHAPDETSVK